METFDEYEAFTNSVAIYPNSETDFIYPLLGLNGEAGEVADKVKKILRKDYELTKNVKRDIVLELGDVLYYITRICIASKIKLSSIARYIKNFDDYNKWLDGMPGKADLINYIIMMNYEAGQIGLHFKDGVDLNSKYYLEDTLYYIARCGEALNVSLKEIVNCNVSKLQYRYETDKVKGSGDHR